MAVEVFGDELKKLAGSNQQNQDALIMLVGLTVGKIVAVAGGAGGSRSNAAAIIAKLATEHNYLKHGELENLRNEMAACKKRGCSPAESERILKEYIRISNENNGELASCMTRECVEQHQREIDKARPLANSLLYGQLNDGSQAIGVLQQMQRTDNALTSQMRKVVVAERAAIELKHWQSRNCSGLSQQQCSVKLNDEKAFMANLIADFTPIVGDIKGFKEAETEKWPRLVGQEFEFVKWSFANVGLSMAPLAAPCIEQERAARWVTRPIIYAACFMPGRCR